MITQLHLNFVVWSTLLTLFASMSSHRLKHPVLLIGQLCFGGFSGAARGSQPWHHAESCLVERPGTKRTYTSMCVASPFDSQWSRMHVLFFKVLEIPVYKWLNLLSTVSIIARPFRGCENHEWVLGLRYLSNIHKTVLNSKPPIWQGVTTSLLGDQCLWPDNSRGSTSTQWHADCWWGGTGTLRVELDWKRHDWIRVDSDRYWRRWRGIFPGHRSVKQSSK